MFSEWTFYFRSIDDAPAAIGLFTDVEESVPRHPHLLCVIVSMLHPSEHGMTDTADPDTLDVIDRALEEHMTRTIDAVYVGRESHNGERTFYFYAPAATGFKTAAQQLMALYPQYRYRLAHRIDPQWSEYFNWLRPKPAESWYIKNMQLIDSMEAHGDDLEMPREIDHWAYFPSAESQNSFVENVKTAGFLVRNTWFGNGANDDDTRCPEGKPYGVQVFRDDPLTLDHVQETVEFLYHSASKLNGHYDGWEAFFVGEGVPVGVI